jgi:predicted dehydrogenase
VAAIIGSTPEKSRQANQSLGIQTNLATFEEVLADPTIHAVHLATPNRLHYPQSIAVLESGKHLLCEKPLAMTTQESAALVRLARATGLMAAVAYNIRFYPLCHEIAERVGSGNLGDLLHVHGSYVQDWLLYETDFNWRVLSEDGGELRAVADIGTHWLDLIQFITGQHIVSVCADLRTVHPERSRPRGGVETFSSSLQTPTASDRVPISTEDCGCVMFRFQDGANGCLWVSQTTAGRKNCLRFEVAGTQGSAAWNSESPNELWLGHRDRSNELLIRDPALLSRRAAAIANYPGGHNEGFPDTFKQLFKSFYGAIERGAKDQPRPFPTLEDGHREIALCEAILESQRRRCWIDVVDSPSVDAD